MEVPEISRRQAGLFTPAQAYDEGWTPRQVRRRVDAGRWKRAAGVALAAAPLECGAHQLAWAVTLTWPGAVVSHTLAAALRRFPVPAPAIGTATVRPDRGLTSRGLIAYRRRLTDDEISQVYGLPTTSERRTALDVLSSLPFEEARRLWAWISTRGILTLDQLRLAADARSGWHGTAQLRELARISAGGALSAGEDRLHALLHRGRVAGWTANAPVRMNGRIIAVADVLFERERVVVEVDGFAHHADPDAFRRDRARQNALVLAGYVVLRFTWRDLTDRPDAVLEEIRRALRPRSAQ